MTDSDSTPTSRRWSCDECHWSGEEAPLDRARMEVYCPNCEETIDDSTRQTLESATGVDLSERGEGSAQCNVCEWEVPAEKMSGRETPIDLYIQHFRSEHADLLEGTRYEQ